MKPLRKLLDRLRPHFEKGGKLEKLYPLFEGGDTFLYTPGEITTGAPHVRDGLDLKRAMITVAVALVPCVLMAMYNTGLQAHLAMTADSIPTSMSSISEIPGWRGAIMGWLGLGPDPNSLAANLAHGALYFLPVYAVCMLAGGVWEVLFCVVRRHELNEGFVVTGLLLPLTLPPTIPLWQVALGTSFGVVLGKEVFGGTGKNFLNPALTGRAFLYFAYPAQITGDFIWTAGGSAIDGFSGATPLGIGAASGLTGILDAGYTFSQAFIGDMAGSMGETSALACLLGAAVLIGTGVGSWQIMVAVVIGAMSFSGTLYAIGSETNPMFSLPPHWHLVTGGFAFGTIFMATDPVSAAMTGGGKWIYGMLIGAMTVMVRVINPAFPEGIMLAILFGNVFAPAIDYYVLQANIKRRLKRSNHGQ